MLLYDVECQRVDLDPLPGTRDAATLFSPMSVAKSILSSLPPALHKNGVVRLASSPGTLAKVRGPEETFSLSEEWQGKLDRGELVSGVIELSSDGGLAMGTSIALRACFRVQESARSAFGVVPWCAFVDPTGSLYAPGVHAAGVDLERLLIVRADEESITRVTLRLVESKVFPLVVVDLMGFPGDDVELSLGSWVRVVRRMSRAMEGSAHSVLLLTDKNAKRTLPLPVTERLILSRRSPTDLKLTVSKSILGTPGETNIRWARRSLDKNCPSPSEMAHAG